MNTDQVQNRSPSRLRYRCKTIGIAALLGLLLAGCGVREEETDDVTPAAAFGSEAASSSGAASSGDVNSGSSGTDNSNVTDMSFEGAWDMTTRNGTPEEIVVYMIFNQVRARIFRDETSFGGDGQNCFTEVNSHEYHPASAYYPDANENQYEFQGEVATLFVQPNGKLYWGYVDRQTGDEVVKILDRVPNVITADDMQICH
ncbi:MAG: hypothetical protein V3U76_02565 [Granulosicoccus sp.]